MMTQEQRNSPTDSPAPGVPTEVVYALTELEIAASLVIPAASGGKDALMKRIADLKALLFPNTKGQAGIHCLKTDSAPFRAAWEGVKTYEVRKFDRAYAIGDQVTLMEHDRETGVYSGAWMRVEICSIVKPGEYGLGPDVGVFGFKVMETKEKTTPPLDIHPIIDPAIRFANANPAAGGF